MEVAYSAFANLTAVLFVQMIHYMSAELLPLWFHRSAIQLAVPHHFLDIAYFPRRRYIHRGAGRSYRIDDSSPINSFWSSSRRHLPRNARRKVDHSALASLARSANVTFSNEHSDIKLY